MRKRMTTKDFIAKAEKIHGNNYDYSLVDYIHYKYPVNIICPEHGVFGQSPNIHLMGSGCPKCGRKSSITSHRLSTPEFIKKAKEIHGDKYDYSLTEYISSKEKVKIICPEHGVFKQSPGNHLAGSGCMKCRKKLLPQCNKFTHDKFIKKLKPESIQRYKYPVISFFEYQSKIPIICPVHGEFVQYAHNHLNQNNGCPKCAEYGFNPDKPAILYYLYDPQEDLYKIGITNKTIEERFGKSFCSNRAIAILEQTHFDNGLDAYLAEQEILEAFGYARCENPSWPETKGGRTEFFKEDILHKHKDD